MFALNLMVIFALVCCVLSESEFKKYGRRYCEKECDNVEVLRCSEPRLPKLTSFYKTCASAKEKGLSTLEELNNHYCEEATTEELFSLLSCTIKQLMTLFKMDEILKTAMECLAESEC